MLTVKINDDGQIYITGDTQDLQKLRSHLSDVIDSRSPYTKTYDDFKWNAWETKQASKTVTISIGS